MFSCLRVLGVLRLSLSMPILLEGAHQLFVYIDPIWTGELRLIFAPASILIRLAPGSPCPQPKHVEGVCKCQLSRFMRQADLWGSCITNSVATFTGCRFYLIPRASRHHRSCNMGQDDAYKSHTHSWMFICP